MIAVLTWVEYAVLVLSAFAVAGVAFAGAAFLEHRAKASPVTVPPDTGGDQANPSYFVAFDAAGKFAHACENADRLLHELGLSAPDWLLFRSAMAPRFAGLPGGITASDRSRFTTHPAHCDIDPMVLELEHHPQGVSARIHPRAQDAAPDTARVHDMLCSLSNLDMIRAASENAPYPVWETQAQGRIGWSNRAYRDLDTQIVRNATAAGAPLFTLPPVAKAEDLVQRIQIQDRDRNRTYWFDVTSRTLGTSQLHFAIDVHAVVNAECAQRNFVQTLAKTFAHLATGLAIFDRNRQLVLFNPALIDLTALPADFLSARPNLFAFFDQLRNNQIMPEPKSYANWRERIADVVSAASEDNFMETWHLPSGLTYRVSGRPHPDGAIAFLIEDISAEIALTRRFRSEMKVAQSAFDALADSVVVFAGDGSLMHINAAMRGFLRLSDGKTDDGLNVQDLTRMWQDKCQPSPIWGEVRDFVAGCAEREEWSAEITAQAGRKLDIQVAPLANGASMVTLHWQADRHSAAKAPRARKKAASRTRTAAA